MNYIDSEHYKKVLAATPSTTMMKHCGTNFMGRTSVKNTIIFRHVMLRMCQCLGPWDGLRSATNYRKSGRSNSMPWNGPSSPWDVHVMTWQLELVADELIEPKEMLSPASIAMYIKWAITTQPLNATWKIRRAAWARAIAVQAGWLLTMDLIKLEEMNKDVTVMDLVTEEPAQEAEPDV
jgi:hypothetical protein